MYSVNFEKKKGLIIVFIFFNIIITDVLRRFIVFIL